MTTSKALFGFSPSRKRGNNPNAIGTNEYPIASGYGANIFLVCFLMFLFV